MAKVYTFIVNSSAITEAKYDRYVAVDNVIRSISKSAYEEIKHKIEHAPEETVEQNADRDTSRVLRPMVKAISPVVASSTGVIVSQTVMYQSYLRNEARALAVAEKVDFSRLSSEMEKVGIKPSHDVHFSDKSKALGFEKAAIQIEGGISATTYDLGGFINHGTIIKDSVTNKYVALKDYADLKVQRVNSVSKDSVYEIKDIDGNTVATVTKKTLEKSFKDRLHFSEISGTGTIGKRTDYVDIADSIKGVNESIVSGNAFKRTILHGDITYDPINKVVEINDSPNTFIGKTVKNAFEKFARNTVSTKTFIDEAPSVNVSNIAYTKDAIYADDSIPKKTPVPTNNVFKNAEKSNSVSGSVNRDTFIKTPEKGVKNSPLKDVLISEESVNFSENVRTNDFVKPGRSIYRVGINTKAKTIQGAPKGYEDIKDHIEFRRKILHYKVSGDELTTFNLRKEAGNSAEMYRRFLHFSKNNKEIDKAAISDAKELRKAMTRLNKSEVRYKQFRKMASPKRLVRSWSRLLLREEMKGSDGNTGYQILDASARPIYMLSRKYVINTIPNSINNAISYVGRRRIQKKWAKDNKELVDKLGKKAFKEKAILYAKDNVKVKHIKIRDINKINPIVRAARENIRYKLTMEYATRLLRSNNDVLKFMGNKAIIKEAMKNSHIGKEVASAYISTNKQILMAHSDIYRKYAERKAYKAAAKTLKYSEKATSRVAAKAAKEAERATKEAIRAAKRAKWVAAVTRRLGLTVKGAKGTAEALSLSEKLAQGIATATKAIIEGIAALLSDPLVDLILVVLLILCLLIGAFAGMGPLLATQAEDYNREAARFESTDYDKWTEYEEKLMTRLKEQHDKELLKIEDYLDDYDTADIEYPSGEQENYKELFVAMEIMIQYNPDCISYDELEDIAETLYERTHQLVRVEYTYYDGEGNPHDACHLYMYIMRGDQLCYEAMADVYSTLQAADAKRGNSHLYCPSTTVRDDNWIAIVRAMKQAIADSNCYYYNNHDKRTDNDTYVRITVNGNTISVRPDCSGLVSACLYIYGSLNNPAALTSSQLASMRRGTSSLNGFTVMDWCGWDNLAEGDIIARNGHTEIYAYTAGGQHWVYNCGSDHSVSVASPTVSGHSSYSTVIRPGNVGNGMSENGGGNPDNNANPGDGMGVAPEVESPQTNVYNLNYNGIVYDANFSPEYVTLPLSNTSSIVFNDDGNEDGYEDILKNDVNNELSGSIFTTSSFELGNKDHTLKSGKASASDFVRYIYAQHGVKFEMDDEYALWNAESVLKDDLMVGDVIWYMPKTNWSKQVANIKPWNEIYDASAIPQVNGNNAEVSEELFFENVVPCIYLGNDEIAAFSRDLSAFNSESTGGKLRKYSLSALDEKYIVVMNHVSGFTSDKIFGSTKFFEGWNDENITYFIEMYYDECWDTGEKKWEFNSEDDWFLGEYARIEPYTVDYSWYSEDYFEGNNVYATNEHYSQFMDDMTTAFIKTYDRYGILPSFGYSYAYVLTNGRTTEESLAYFNIFEMPDVSRSEDGYVDRYSYNDEGESSVESIHYKVFGSYEECIKEYYKYLIDERKDSSVIDTVHISGDMSDSENGAYETFSSQLGAFNTNLLATEENTEITDIYNQNKGELDDADKIAIDRKKTLMAINHYSRVINEECSRVSIGSYNSLDTYLKFKAYENILSKAISHFEDTYSGTKYCTTDNTITISNARSALSRCQTVTSSLMEYRENNKDYYITGSSLICNGHFDKYCSEYELPYCDHYDSEKRRCLGHGNAYYCSGCEIEYDYEDWNIGNSCFGHGSSYCSGDTKCQNLIYKGGNLICGGHGMITYCSE